MKESTKNSILIHLPRSKIAYKLALNYVRHYKGFNYSDHERNGELPFLRRVIGSKLQPMVFDVGANIGDYTLGVLAGSSAAQIHAFEPARSTYQLLITRVQHERVKLLSLAVGEESGQATFYEHGHSHLFSLYEGSTTGDVHYEVELVSVDGYCELNRIAEIDYLKIDVEGHDLAVLRGAHQMLQNRKIAVAQFEYGPPAIDSRVFLKDFYEFTREIGYKLVRIYPGFVLLTNHYSTVDEDFINRNYAMVRPDVLVELGNYVRNH